MKRFIKILCLIVACSACWYGGWFSAPRAKEVTVHKLTIGTQELRKETPKVIAQPDDEKVYVIRDGVYYHYYECPYLKPCIETTPEGAKEADYIPCDFCLPPR